MNSQQALVEAAPEHRFQTAAALAGLKQAGKCKNVDKGRQIHAHALRQAAGPHGLNLYMASSVIGMYGSCGFMHEAQRVFDQMPLLDVVLWNALILGYATNGEGGRALNLFRVMCENDVQANSRTFVALIKACSSVSDDEERDVEKVVKVKSLEVGMALHSRVLATSCDSIYVSSCLVNMYVRCGSLSDAQRVFDLMPERNVVSWTCLMIGYADVGDGETALRLFSEMQVEEICLDAQCFVAAFKACSALAVKEEGVEFDGRLVRLKALEVGMAVHFDAVKRGFHKDVFVAAGIVNMYAKVGWMDAARNVFEKFASKDVVAWTALMLGYADNGEHETAIQVFMSMASSGHAASTRTYVAVLKACCRLAEEEAGSEVDDGMTKVKSLTLGMSLHSEIARSGADTANNFVGNTLIDMYARCGSMRDSQRVFDRILTLDVVSWNALISGYAENGNPEAALEMFVVMQTQGFVPDTLTYLAVVKACTSAALKERFSRNLEQGSRLVKFSSLEKGMAVHAEAAKGKFDEDRMVASSLVDMYLKCGSTDDAQRTFEKIQSPDRIAWTILVCGYIENVEGDAALHLLRCMEMHGFEADSSAYVGLLKACGVVGDFATGRVFHCKVCEGGLENKKILIAGLIDFYGKCGKMAQAHMILDSSAEIDAVTWTALLAGYGRDGNTSAMFQVFENMVENGVEPASVTFLCLLTACSHAGLVDRGKTCFEEMEKRYRIKAGREHYHCVIDLLGRANHLGEAVRMIELMPYEPNAVTWITLLSACRQWANADIGSFAFDSLAAIKGGHAKSSAYLLMANIYER